MAGNAAVADGENQGEGVKKPKQTCVGCHFFQSEERTPEIHRFVISEENRERSLDGDFEWRPNGNLGCHMGVWDEGVGLPGSFEEVVLQTERKGFCFFWPFTSGMLFPAAKTLQERAAEKEEAATDRRLTIRGLRIAGFGLIVTAIIALINLIINFYN